MGATLPKAVMSTVVERHASDAFRVAAAELNGWRNSMEDAHIIHLRPTWAFFGVFDGHGGQQCSTFVAKRMKDQIENEGCPIDDAACKKMMLDIDKAFLDTGAQSGSTATMCIVTKPTATCTKHKLRVINAGDSRVVLGRLDGTIFDGGRTDQGLTTDHKPDHPDEEARILRCGGTVEMPRPGMPGCARVNGDLAVSRGFGDADHKKTGGPEPENRPVTADPELGEYEADDTDFLLLICDGVVEGDFSNAQVVEHAARYLRENGNDAGAAAREICLESVRRNSKDNVTCMIVLFRNDEGSDSAKKTGHEFLPGPYPVECRGHDGFVKAYQAMAGKVDYTLAQAVELRYRNVKNDMTSLGDAHPEAAALKDELNSYGEQPDDNGEPGSEERIKWFDQWLRKPENQHVGGDMHPFANGGQQNQGTRRIRASSLEILKKEVGEHAALKWDDRMTNLAEKVGVVLQDDSSDGTSRVRFEAEGMLCWLPTKVLQNLDEPEASPEAVA